MNGIMAFFSAALPWIVMGVALAIFFAREGKRKKRREDHQKKKDDYGSEGMALGMLLGLTIGSGMEKKDGDE